MEGARAKAYALLVALVGAVSSTSGLAQNPFELFGGVFAAAQAQAAREAWGRIPDADRTCLERALEARGGNLVGVIQSGVMPDDPRVASFTAQCRRFTQAALRRDYTCTILDEDGRSVGSTCRQSFARRGPDGRAYPVSIREAVDLQFSGSPPVLVDLEMDEARQERRERQEMARRVDQVAGLRARVADLQRSPSPIVRSETAKVLTRIDQQASSRPGPAASVIEGLDRDAQALARLAEAESLRHAALERLAAVKAQADARTHRDTADPMRKRLDILNAEYAVVSVPPRAPPPPSQPAPAPTASGSGVTVGPSFDCAKALTPLPQIVCGNATLRLLDLELLRPYYALRHLLPDRLEELKAEAVELGGRVVSNCKVPETGRASADLARRAAPCITAAYRSQKEAWERRVAEAGPVGARQEITRPVQDHIRLQNGLRTAGYLPAEAPSDGVYGGTTRRAIMALQQAEGLVTDGFLSEATAARLSRQTASSGAPEPPTIVTATPDLALPQRIAALHERYVAYLNDISAGERERAAKVAVAERERAARDAALAQLRERRAMAQRLLDRPLPDDLRSLLRGFLNEIGKAEQSGAPADLARADTYFVQFRPRLETAEALAQATTDKNRFLIEGDPDDVLFLYNASPKAPSVVRGLGGDLVFDRDRTLACILHEPVEPVEDWLTLREMRGKAAALGATLRFPLARCPADRLQNQDVLVFHRGALLQQPLGFITTLASAVDSGVYGSMGLLTGAELKRASQADAVAATEVESLVEKATSGGFAVLLVGEGSRLVCRVIPSSAEKVHERLLQGHHERLIDELRGTPASISTSRDGAFLSAKRGQCGAVYASAPDLKVIRAALSRDGQASRLLPIWVAPDLVQAEHKAEADREAETQRRQVEEAEARRRDALESVRRLSLSRLANVCAGAEQILKTPLPSDFGASLTAFVARCSNVDDATELSLLEELESEFAGMRPRLDEAGKLARATTPRSRDLLAGGRGDLVILHNASGTAPSVARNLRGELVFADGKAAACVFHPPIDDIFLNRQIREKAASLGTRLSFPLPACDPAALAKIDLVIAERDRLLREPIDRVIALMEALNKGAFAPVAVLTGPEFADARRSEGAKAEEIEAAVRARRSENRFGLVALGNASSVVCKVPPSDQEAHAAVLQRLDERLRDELPGAPLLRPTTAEGAFLSAKRGQCGAVYADGETLAVLVQALERDGIAFRFLPVWVHTEEVAAVGAALGERKRAEAGQEADLRREREDKARLQALKDGEREKVRAEQQNRLRSQYGAMARAFELSLAQELKDYVQDQPSNFVRKYPDLAQHYAELRSDSWEFMTLETSMADYGTAEYKGRPLEAAFANSRIRLRNRVLGEYKDLCFTTGFINDTEFGVEREPLGISCDRGAAAVGRYKQEQRFTSRWFVP